MEKSSTRTRDGFKEEYVNPYASALSIPPSTRTKGATTSRGPTTPCCCQLSVPDHWILVLPPCNNKQISYQVHNSSEQAMRIHGESSAFSHINVSTSLIHSLLLGFLSLNIAQHDSSDFKNHMSTLPFNHCYLATTTQYTAI